MTETVHATIMLDRSSIVNGPVFSVKIAVIDFLRPSRKNLSFARRTRTRGQWYNYVMDDPEHESTHQVLPAAKLTWLVRGLAVQFHPSIKLDKKKGLEFAPKIASAIDPREVILEEQSWVFSQPMGDSPEGRLLVGIQDGQLNIEASHPTESEEMFETRARVIVNEFKKFFKPELMLSSNAMVRATLQVDGDARTFLAEHVTKFDSQRLGQLGRPLHLFGLRLFMPPFQVEKRPAKPAGAASKAKKKKPAKSEVETTDWMVDVKAESMIDDTSKLFLEADARWEPPAKWNDSVSERIVQRLGVVSGFLQKNFIPFLKYQGE